MGIPKEGVVTPDIGTGIHDILKFQPDFHDFFVGYTFFQCMYVYIYIHVACTCSLFPSITPALKRAVQLLDWLRNKLPTPHLHLVKPPFN